MPVPGKGRPFAKGNPGKPKGARDRFPRGFVKSLALAVIEGNEAAIREAVKRAATNPRTVLHVLDLAAKLNREIGHGVDGSAGVTIVNVQTSVNPLALRAAASKALQRPSIDAANPGDRVPKRRPK